jgi:outer membrane protein assembly factor BamE (lipoprotein component of BamABCDE complex)
MRSSAIHRRPSAPLPVMFLILGLAPALAGCGLFAPIPTDRGTFIEAADYDKLIPGTTTRAAVTSLIGSPTAHATFDDNTWIYIGEVTAPVPTMRPTVEKQKVLVLTFDQGGVLRSRRLLDKTDGTDVAMAPGVTPSPGSETSFLQQLIGGVGRYSPLGGLGSNTLGNANNGYGHGGTGNTVGGGS